MAERGLWPLTPSDQAYLAAGALVFVAVFSGLANAAYATAREWEQGTVRVVLTSPVPTAGLLGAKLVTASLQSVPGVLVAVGFVSLGIGIRPAASG
ncbi:MAG: ABC transporter permease [Actinomycetia bacterium]|nr:ABC transporter permease [Actinomycetes bacterium]